MHSHNSRFCTYIYIFLFKRNLDTLLFCTSGLRLTVFCCLVLVTCVVTIVESNLEDEHPSIIYSSLSCKQKIDILYVFSLTKKEVQSTYCLSYFVLLSCVDSAVPLDTHHYFFESIFIRHQGV